jgi:anaerobic selenocysteine-containing dehydrogenase
MKRVEGTERGAGQWKRITWEEAMNELAQKFQAVRDDNPGKLMLHYGRMKASSSKLMKDYFLYGFGSKNYAGHTGICESNKWTSQELIWGKHYDVNDVENSKTILVFGSNPLEAHTNHIPLAQRVIQAINTNGVKMYTFDVRLSNTANKSTQWIPIKPGTDLAVVLAMAYHILTNDLLPQQGKDFINMWTNIDATGYANKVAKLTAVLQNPREYLSELRYDDASFSSFFTDDDQPAGGYTPAWASSISGVPAGTIESIAEEYAANSPGSTIISYRGAVMHFNGVMTENAVQMLEGMCGNIDVPGGRVHAVGASWSYSSTYPKPSSSGLSSLSLQNDGAYVKPSHHASHLPGLLLYPRVCKWRHAGKYRCPEKYKLHTISVGK